MDHEGPHTTLSPPLDQDVPASTPSHEYVIRYPSYTVAEPEKCCCHLRFIAHSQN